MRRQPSDSLVRILTTTTLASIAVSMAWRGFGIPSLGRHDYDDTYMAQSNALQLVYAMAAYLTGFGTYLACHTQQQLKK